MKKLNTKLSAFILSDSLVGLTIISMGLSLLLVCQRQLAKQEQKSYQQYMLSSELVNKSKKILLSKDKVNSISVYDNSVGTLEVKFYE